MDIEGLGPKTVEILYDNGFVKSVRDLYTFDYNLLAGLKGFGSESRKIDGIKMAIEQSRRTPFRNVLVSLGIPEFGRKAVDLVCDAGYDSMDKLLAVADADDIESLSSINGIGPVTAQLIVDGLKSEETRRLIDDLRKAGLQMQDKKQEGPVYEQIFEGQSWCVTGTFVNFNPRSKAMDEIKRREEDLLSPCRKRSGKQTGQGQGLWGQDR